MPQIPRPLPQPRPPLPKRPRNRNQSHSNEAQHARGPRKAQPINHLRGEERKAGRDGEAYEGCGGEDGGTVVDCVDVIVVNWEAEHGQDVGEAEKSA